MTSNSDQLNSEKICPYLGVLNDERTAMAYPTKQNYCHQCVPPNVPNISHQREYCLSEKHTDCPLFVSDKIQPMPPELLSSQSSDQGWTRKKIVGLVLLILVILLAAFIWFTRSDGLDAIFFPSPTVTPTVAVTLAASLPTATVFPTATATLLPPSLTSTPVQPHELETPIGTQNQLLVHQVKEAESLISLAEAYHTSAAAIKAINYSGTLWVDSLVVIPVGQTDVSAYPQFKIIQIAKDGTSLSDLAVQYSQDIALLSQYNQLPENYVFHSGEWALIPVVKATP